MRILLALFLLIECAAPAAAQGVGGFIVDYLEDSLSGENRQVTVTGLEGALSSRATLKQLTVADDQGVWLTITNAVLDWNRSDILRGNIVVNQLTAESIVVTRPPVAAGGSDLPSPEAQPFALPDLPVAIDIARLAVDRVVLAKPVLGLAAELKAEGRFSLSGGTLDSALTVERLDRPGDRIELAAGFDNETRQIKLDLTATEAEGGLISELLTIPDRPSVRLTAKGEGPVDDFAADIALATDGTERVTGKVSLQGGAAETAGIAFTANLAGDLTPMLAGSYREFFGTHSQLALQGQTSPDGSLSVPSFALQSNALDLTGSLALAPGNRLAKVEIEGTIRPPEGETVVLPLGEPAIRLRGATLSGGFDASAGDGWRLTLDAGDIGRAGVEIGSVNLTAEGRLTQGATTTLDGSLKAALYGLELGDAALTQAIGDMIALDGRFGWSGGAAFRVEDMALTGADYSARVTGEAEGLASGFAVDGRAEVAAQDLSRFAGLAGLDLGGAMQARLEGSGTPLGGAFAIRLEASAQDLSAGIAAVDPLIGGKTELKLEAGRDSTGTTIRTFSLDGSALSAQAQGVLRTGQADLTFRGRLDDLARVVPALPGPVTLSGDVSQAGTTVTGKLRLAGPNSSYAMADGTVETDGRIDITYRAQADGLERLVPQLDGMLVASGQAKRSVDAAWNVDARAGGTAGLTGQFRARFSEVTGIADIGFDAALARLERFVPQIKGTLSARGLASRTADAEWKAQLRTEGDAGISGNFGAAYQEASGDLALTFDGLFERLERLVPELKGALAAKGSADRSGDGHWQGEAEAEGSAGISGRFDGSFEEATGGAALAFDAALARIERIVPGFPGTLAARGTAALDGEVWSWDADAKGPGGVDAALAGQFDQAQNRVDATAKGQAQLGLANAFIRPNALSGEAKFDLAMNGPPALHSLSGEVSTSGTSLAIPSAAQTLTGIGATARLANGSARFSASGGLRAGGRFSVEGSAGLEAPFATDAAITLDNIVITDNLSYSTTANGRLRFNGPAVGGAMLSGRIDFGSSEINLATASGAVGAAPIPDIVHVGEPGAVRRTRARAGLIDTSGNGASAEYGLDLTLSAPNRIFARGRGLDAELGGTVVLRGTTLNVVPSGQISLIRGIFDILGRRLKLDEGRISLQGRLEPYVEFRATTSTGEGQATLAITGPVDAPVIAVTSVPERPSEEALALLLFGDKFTELSPLKIAQLASQLATLGGKGGGFLGSVRKGLGVDTLDVGTDSDGNARVGVGGYISENIHTDVNLNAEGETEVNLNLDLTDSLSVKGSVDSQGNTGVGLFFEKDY